MIPITHTPAEIAHATQNHLVALSVSINGMLVDGYSADDLWLKSV